VLCAHAHNLAEYVNKGRQLLLYADADALRDAESEVAHRVCALQRSSIGQVVRMSRNHMAMMANKNTLFVSIRNIQKPVVTNDSSFEADIVNSYIVYLVY
jgi:hypothetical protein